MPISMWSFDCALLNNKIYCIGGYNGSAALNSVYIYDITNNSWSTGANMHIIAHALGCIAYNNKIYCIGGYNRVSVLNTVEVLYVSYKKYTLSLPSIIQNKLNKIMNNSSGTKVFSNDGNYKEIIPNYTNMNDIEISNYIATLTGGV